MIIIGITGTLGAGKGTIVEYLISKKNFKHFSVRQYLSELIKSEGSRVDRTSLVNKGNELRQKYGPGYIAEELSKKAKKSGKDSVIESLRSPGEVEALKRKGNFILLAVDANPKVRYQRIYERASETDKIPFKEFISNEQREMISDDPFKQNLSKCIEMSDYLINNDGDLENLYGQVEKAIQKIK